MRFGEQYETEKYFCCTCGLICRGAEAFYQQGKLPDQGDPITDLRLICTCCGTDHLARLFYGSQEYSLLLVRHEHERIAITPSHIEWHAKRQAERAVATLLSSSGSAHQKKVVENEQYLKKWRGSVQTNVDLLPRKRQINITWNEIAFYGIAVIASPVIAIIVVYDWIKSARGSLPAERRRREQENEKWIERFQAIYKSRLDAVNRDYREVRSIALPVERKPTGRVGYIGYELDNPPPPSDFLEDGLKQFACAGCGELGSLIYSFRDGMTCPCCQADTLEESFEQRERNSAIWD